MERHTAVPDLNGADRIGENGAEVVEEDVADAASEYDTAGGPEQEIVELLQRDRRGLVAPERVIHRQAARIEPADQDACDIGEPVPVDGERPDLEDDGVDFGEGKDGETGR
ncbi:hypothetical protein D9M70_543450 [compost metagenome]